MCFLRECWARQDPCVKLYQIVFVVNLNVHSLRIFYGRCHWHPYLQSNPRGVHHQGPIFTNFLLADEINRAPAKVQSALLEGMQERQVTIGDETFPLPSPFLVLATENPIDQEGTYPLPEAQMDRFMLKLLVNYPDRSEELKILDANANVSVDHKINPIVRPAI